MLLALVTPTLCLVACLLAGFGALVAARGLAARVCGKAL